MPIKEPKIISNVLISAGENKLRLCDIIFDSAILEIKPKTEILFDWEDLKDIESRNNILDKYSERKSEDNYLFAMPGAIDSHVHFDTPGYEFREDFEHASASAACGGVTTVLDMPCTSKPPVTDAASLNIKKNAVAGRSFVDYAFWGGVSGNEFDDLQNVEKNIIELSEEGVAGFKAYLISSMDSFKELSAEQMNFAASVVNKVNKPLAVHSEDKDLVSFKIDRFGWMGVSDWHSYCQARDEQAEGAAVETMISIARAVNCKIHIVHLSSALGLKMLQKAKEEGICITAETCPHYLYFTQKDFENPEIRNYLKTAPPVKFNEDRESLWSGLSEGLLQFVTTDHAGCNPVEEKASVNFFEVYAGIPGVQHRVPFLFSEGFIKGKLSLEKTVSLLSSNHADYFKLGRKGFLKTGFDADIALINLWKSQIIKPGYMHSKGKYTPFENVRFDSVVEKTFLRGDLIAAGGELLNKKSSGEFIRI